MPRIRTGFSFRAAVGKIEDVMARLVECGYPAAPITDRASTFGFVKWSKLAKANNLKPVFGIELAVTETLREKKQTLDYWTFIAKDSLIPIHDLFELATEQFYYEPVLTYEQACGAKGLYKITGHRSKLSLVTPAEDIFVSLGPSSAKGYINDAIFDGHEMIMCSDNKYTNQTESDQVLYETICGREASTQVYDQFIQTPDQWLKSIQHKAPDYAISSALQNASMVLDNSTATLLKANLPEPEKPDTLRGMCEHGAVLLDCDLDNPVYSDRLDRELALIAEKNFEAYFYIIADICSWARARMIVGPARGSSAGSLVCYLLGITTIDPIPHSLIFERFVDVQRYDLPDIDIDFSMDRRELVFEYITNKFKAEHVARLGSVAMYKPPSALKEAGAALLAPKWRCDAVAESLLKRSSGDARALDSLADTFTTMPAGKELIEECPEMIIATRMEGHPRHHSQHAAGIVLTEQPVNHYVAIDRRTGAAHCDKKDAEELNLLKIDALGLTQLSVFEYALELAGLDRLTLETIPMEDPAAFKILNEAKFCGIFQFNGMALQSIVKQFNVSKFDDIVSVTALARPGPLASGGAHEWVKRKNGTKPIEYPHAVFEPYLKGTLGIVLYQEQVMEIGRNVGGLDWADVTALRKAMSKSLGVEYFDKFGDRFKVGARQYITDEKVLYDLWTGLCAMGSWTFNKCLSGDTKIKLSSGGQYLSGEPTIKELYERYELNPTAYSRKKGKPALVSLYPDGKGWPQKPTRISYSGKKHCWEYTFSDGSKVTCTKQHKFLINDSWKAIGNARFGDVFSSLEYDKDFVVKGMLSGKGQNFNKGKSYKKKQSGFAPGGENISWVNGLTPAKQNFITEHSGQPCADCNKIKKRMEAHHNDFNSGRDKPDDLAWLCAGCHKKRHYANGRKKRWSKGHKLCSKFLTAKKYAGVIDTYDIEMPEHHNFRLANGLITHNSHAVSYGIISYQCCWLKAHYPFEFAAATLSYESDKDKQLQMLREMVEEGYEYVSVDSEYSTDRWTVGLRDGKRILVGPLTGIKGIGPKTIETILTARKNGHKLPARALKLIAGATSIDSLNPIHDAITRLLPNSPAKRLPGRPVTLKKIEIKAKNYEVLVYVALVKINPRDENEAINIAKRGGQIITGEPTTSLNLQLRDDTDTVFGKISRWDYEKLGKPIVDHGRTGKCLYAIRGIVKGGAQMSFRMISIKDVAYIGDMDEGKEGSTLPADIAASKVDNQISLGF
jgi:hypothetical protein